jgi:hypothetical protein
MPRVEVDAFLADSVQASGGKLHALGIGWRAIVVQGLPARHDRVGIGVLIRTAPAEAGPHRLALSVLDPDGRPMPFGPERSALEATFQSPSGEGTTTLALNLDGIVFDRVGTFTVVLGVDDREVRRLPFRIQTQPEPPAQEVRSGVYI